jgi:hypothetical protein
MKLLFLHVPKTAGSTIKSFLGATVGDIFIQANSVEQLERGDPLVGRVRDLDDITRVLAAHRGLALHVDSNFDAVRRTTDFRSLAWHVFAPEHRQRFAGVTILTMFRHPLQRFLSDYRFVRRMKAADAAFLPDLQVGTPAEYLEHHHPNALLHFLLEPDLPRRRTMTRADLEHVQACLTDTPIHVGIQERFDESIDYFGRVLDRRFDAAAVPTLNAAPDAPVADRELERVFAERSALDLELYAYAVRLFETRTSAYDGHP